MLHVWRAADSGGTVTLTYARGKGNPIGRPWLLRIGHRSVDTMINIYLRDSEVTQLGLAVGAHFRARRVSHRRGEE